MSKCDENNVNCNDQKNILISCLLSLPPQQFSLLSSIIGLVFTEKLNLNEQNSLGNFIVGVGQTILTSAAQGQFIESLKATDNSNQQSDDQSSDSSNNDKVEDEKDSVACKIEIIEKQIVNIKKDIFK